MEQQELNMPSGVDPSAVAHILGRIAGIELVLRALVKKFHLSESLADQFSTLLDAYYSEISGDFDEVRKEGAQRAILDILDVDDLYGSHFHPPSP